MIKKKVPTPHSKRLRHCAILQAFLVMSDAKNKVAKPTSAPHPLNHEGLEHFARRARLQRNIYHTCECASF